MSYSERLNQPVKPTQRPVALTGHLMMVGQAPRTQQRFIQNGILIPQMQRGGNWIWLDRGAGPTSTPPAVEPAQVWLPQAQQRCPWAGLTYLDLGPSGMGSPEKHPPNQQTWNPLLAGDPLALSYALVGVAVQGTPDRLAPEYQALLLYVHTILRMAQAQGEPMTFARWLSHLENGTGYESELPGYEAVVRLLSVLSQHHALNTTTPSILLRDYVGPGVGPRPNLHVNLTGHLEVLGSFFLIDFWCAAQRHQPDALRVQPPTVLVASHYLDYATGGQVGRAALWPSRPTHQMVVTCPSWSACAHPVFEEVWQDSAQHLLFKPQGVELEDTSAWVAPSSRETDPVDAWAKHQNHLGAVLRTEPCPAAHQVVGQLATLRTGEGYLLAGDEAVVVLAPPPDWAAPGWVTMSTLQGGTSA